MLEDQGTLSIVALEPLNLVLLTGMSGAGKSVALRALEDTGYFCVDNLPAELIVQLLKTLQMQSPRRQNVAIAVDGRSPNSLPLLPKILQSLENSQIKVKLLYLDANDDALIRRFSETRRRHPLSSQLNEIGDEHGALVEAIERERALLCGFKEAAAVMDTSVLQAAQLQSWVKTIVQIPHNTLTLVFESFAFKRGIPVDADFVFDVRILPNPYYVPELRSLTGKDFPIEQWLRQHKDVLHMQSQIEEFLREWLPAFVRNHRSYLTIAIGCTGGQHRSVYLAEQLAQVFKAQWSTVVRHRELTTV